MQQLLKKRLLARKESLQESKNDSFVPKTKNLKRKNPTEIPLSSTIKNNKESNKQQKKSVTSKMQNQLKGAQFRWLNEHLYTHKSEDSFSYFQKDPNQFRLYHVGFQSQVQKWPVNPVDIFIESLRKQPKLVIGDFGCGVAQIAKTLSKNKVHSFDLVAANEFVTACDVAHTPLDNNVLDVALFCLSLMGSNFLDFIREAHRVLKPNGLLKVAEVTSRFNVTNEGHDVGLKRFIRAICDVGFTCLFKNLKNPMFVICEFRKCDKQKTSSTSLLEADIMKPCRYKKR